MTYICDMKILILILLGGILTPKSGIVTTTICNTWSDSCMVRIKLDNLNRDTVVYYPKNSCPKLLDKINFEK